MSLIKRYQDDSADLQYRAMCAAWQPTAKLRMSALTQVFEDCGKAANAYADPTRVTQLFVSAVVRAFMDERKAKVYRVAG